MKSLGRALLRMVGMPSENIRWHLRRGSMNRKGSALDKRIVASYLAGPRPHKLHIGCGYNVIPSGSIPTITRRTQLCCTLQDAGFQSIVRCALQESTTPELRNLEHETRMPPDFLRLETMTLEGSKLSNNQ